MTMNEVLVTNIYNDILELSDINLQRKLWLGADNNHISSFVELYCRLFDDNCFDCFVEREARLIGFPSDFIVELKKLRIMLNDYEGSESVNQIWNDTKWLDVVNCARGVIQIWDTLAGGSGSKL